MARIRRIAQRVWSIGAVLALTLALASCSKTTAGPVNPSPGSQGSGGGPDQLSQLSGKFAATPAKVSYTFTSDTGGGTFVLFWKPPSSSREDITNDGQTITIMNVGGNSYYCTSGACIQSAAGTQAPLPFFGLFAQPGSLSTQIAAGLGGGSYQVSHTSIAGQAATCFSASQTSSSQVNQGEYCLSGDGILLRAVTTTNGVSSKMEATTVGQNVSDADFQLPYPVTTLPTGFPTSTP